MTCKHEYIEIIEYGCMNTSHIREGGLWSHDSAPAEYTGIVCVICHDCGLRRRYGKRRPKWLRSLISEW